MEQFFPTILPTKYFSVKKLQVCVMRERPYAPKARTRSGDIYDVITLSESIHKDIDLCPIQQAHMPIYNASMCVLFIAHKSRGNNI